MKLVSGGKRALYFGYLLFPLAGHDGNSVSISPLGLMAGWPSGKARLCKSCIRRFDSDPRLQIRPLRVGCGYVDLRFLDSLLFAYESLGKGSFSLREWLLLTLGPGTKGVPVGLVLIDR